MTRHEWISATKLATDYNSKDNVYVPPPPLTIATMLVHHPPPEISTRFTDTSDRRDIFVTVALWDEHEPKQLSMPSNTGFGSVMSAHQYRYESHFDTFSYTD